MRKRVVIVTCAGTDIGYGHLMRCRKIAAALIQKGAEVRIILASHDGDAEARIIAAKTAPVTLCKDKEESITAAVKELKPNVLLVDMQSKPLGFLKGQGIFITTLDNYTPGADLYINIRHKNFNKGEAKELNGLEYWAANSPETVQEEVKEKVGRVLISCGYTDPEELTLPILKRILTFHKEKRNSPPRITCIITSTFKEEIEKELETYPEVRIVKDCTNMGKELTETDIAITQGGSTTIEALLHRTPSIIVPVGKHNELLATELTEKGFAIDSGKAENVKGAGPSGFEEAYAQLQEKEKRAKLNAACAGFDVAGATRIADTLLALGAD